MRTIAFINQKGGCGKTTCSVNTAACLANLGQKTLLVDMDPQGHCAVGLAVPDSQVSSSIYDVLRDPIRGKTVSEITWQIAANFDLAPSNISLVALESELHGLAGRQDRLADALAEVSSKYDYCIIDCPPNVGLLTFNAMRAADEVIIPVETGYFSLHGLAKQLELLQTLRQQCKQDVRVRILATLYDIRTKLAREVLAELREQFGDLLMDSAINFNTKLKEAASFGQPINEYDPASKGYKDFLKLVKEVMGPTAPITLDSARLMRDENVIETTDDSDADEAPLEIEETPAPSRLPSLAAIARRPVITTAPNMSPARTTVQAQPVIVAAPAQTLAPATPMFTTPTIPTHATPAPASIPTIAATRSVDDELSRRANVLLQNARTELDLPIPTRATNPAAVPARLAEFYGAHQSTDGVVFLAKLPTANSVGIAGDFNNWSPETARMTADTAGNFRTKLNLAPGRYRYRLVVDGNWQHDPHNTNTEPNPFGGVNSVVEVV
jgi:chromosome partitioning protein